METRQIEVVDNSFVWVDWAHIEGTFDSMITAHGTWKCQDTTLVELVWNEAEEEWEEVGYISAEGTWTASYLGADCVEGDVNGDGEIRSNDAMLVLQIAAGLMEPTAYQECAADVNGDSKVRSNDAMIILRTAAGLD
jgi:hypothetical protein